MCNQTDDHACHVKIIIGTLTVYFRNNFMMEPSATLHPVKGSSAFIWVVSTVNCPKFFRFMCLYLPIPLHNKTKCRELQQKLWSTMQTFTPQTVNKIHFLKMQYISYLAGTIAQDKISIICSKIKDKCTSQKHCLKSCERSTNTKIYLLQIQIAKCSKEPNQAILSYLTKRLHLSKYNG